MDAECARPEEIDVALNLVFQHLTPDERDSRIANARSLIASGELDPEGIRVIRTGQTIVAAMVAMSLPGAGGLVWLPGVLAGPRTEQWEVDIVQSACSWLRKKGAKVVQALLLRQELGPAAVLVKNGFAYVTELEYLRHDLSETPVRNTPEGVEFQNHTTDIDPVFRKTLLDTYVDTLDCPELNGVRTIDEILEGHRAQGGPWWLILRFGRPVGVLLLSRLPETSIWDLAYVGVAAGARRRGVGRAAILHAIEEIQLYDADQLTVAVDIRNTPARQLYHQLGFTLAGKREVFLHFPAQTRQ